MIVNHDFFGEVESPTLYLCNPGCTYDQRTRKLSNAIGAIPNPSDIEGIINFNAESELNLRLEKITNTGDEELDKFIEDMFVKVKNKRLIFADGFGFFSITSIEQGFDGLVDYKDITATSCECELQNKGIPYIEDGTYSFQEIMDMVIGAAPIWTYDIDTVPRSIKDLYRTFEDVDVDGNIHSFLMDSVQDAFECIFTFDCINRVVHVYDQNDYVNRTPILLTRDSFITKVDISEGTEDLYTAIRVSGDSDVGINSVNPNGTSTIYNFDYYLEWMSPELREIVERWKDNINTYSDMYYHINLEYYELLSKKNTMQQELNMLQSRIDMYSKMKANVVASRDRTVVSNYNNDITATDFVGVEVTDEYDSSKTYSKGERVLYNGTGYICYESINTPEEWNGEHWIKIVKEANTVEIKDSYEGIQDEINDFIAQINGFIDECNKNYDAISYEMSNLVVEPREVGDDGFDNSSIVGKRLDRIDYTYTQFSDTALYVPGDIVLFDEQYYRCAENVYPGPWNGTKWILLIETIEDMVVNIRHICSLERLFEGKRDLFDELQNFIFEGQYTDEYVKITENMDVADRFDQVKKMYDRAMKQLVKISSPTQEFKVDVQDFIFTSETKELAECLNVGTLVTVEVDDGDMAELFVTNITVNYEDRSVSITFGNRFNRFDQKALFENALGNIKKTSNSLNYMKDILYPVKTGTLNAMSKAIENSRTLTKNAVLASSNQSVVIDDNGYTGKSFNEDGTEDKRQVKITGSTLAFTEDGWETAGVAMGELVFVDSEGNPYKVYGINAEHIIGDIVIGRNLNIFSETVDENGEVQSSSLFEVIDDHVVSQVTSEVEGLSTRIDQNAESIRVSAERMETNFEIKTTYDDDGNVISTDYVPKYVRTSSGYEFGSDGLIISTDGSEIENRLNNEGMYVYRKYRESEDTDDGGSKVEEKTEEVLRADTVGVTAENISVRKYLNIGNNSRIEDYIVYTTAIDDTGKEISGAQIKEYRTACFYIGDGYEIIEAE